MGCECDLSSNAIQSRRSPVRVGIRMCLLAFLHEPDIRHHQQRKGEILQSPPKRGPIDAGQSKEEIVCTWKYNDKNNIVPANRSITEFHVLELQIRNWLSSASGTAHFITYELLWCKPAIPQRPASLHPLHVTPKPCRVHHYPDQHSRTLLAQFGLTPKSRRGLAASEV